ncbi:hypothetical protein Tco_1007420 [Tanacetum coccineum]
MDSNDPILTIMRFIPKHESVQKYDAIIPDTLTNQAMKDSDAYKTYYDLVTGKVIPKPKLKAIAKVDKSGKNKLPAQGLETLSEITLSKAEQMKIPIERSKPIPKTLTPMQFRCRRRTGVITEGSTPNKS